MARNSTRTLILAVMTGLVGWGCDSGSDPDPSSSQVTGLASSAAAATEVSLRDSSTPAITRTAVPDGSGGFSFDTTGMTPPFFLKAQTATGPEYSIAPGSGMADVNPITTAACAGAASDEASEDGEHGWSGGDSAAPGRFEGILVSLRLALKPLFDLYGIEHIGGDVDDATGTKLRALLQDVSFAVSMGMLTVTNSATSAVIFTGPLRHLSLGTFTSANMPAGPGGPTCTSFTYSAFGACQPDGTQTRTVLTSSPTDCTGGSPVLTQTCTYVPSCTLTTAVPSCTTCHGAIGSGSHAGRALTCATCHGPVNNGTGTPSTGMVAALAGATCALAYPVAGTHGDSTVNRGAAP